MLVPYVRRPYFSKRERLPVLFDWEKEVAKVVLTHNSNSHSIRATCGLGMNPLSPYEKQLLNATSETKLLMLILMSLTRES